MTECLKEETIQAYLDGELTTDAEAAVLTHLNGCLSCADIAREIERAATLINRAFDDELPEDIPSLSLRMRLDDALAQKTPGFADSFRRRLYNLASDRFKFGDLSPLRLGLAVAVVIVVVILAGLANNFWRSSTVEQKLVRQKDAPNPVPSQVQEQRQEPDNSRNRPKRGDRRDQLAYRIRPKSIQPGFVEKSEPVRAVSNIGYIKSAGNKTFRNPETSEHLMQTQLLLRSFRNSSIDAVDAAFDLGYEKRLSRELLSKNRLFRRSAESKKDSQAKDLLSQIEPLLLDIANLPDQPSQDEVRMIKDLMREQKIIATLQIYTARAGF
jgi:hypothetical protein